MKKLCDKSTSGVSPKARIAAKWPSSLRKSGITLYVETPAPPRNAMRPEALIMARSLRISSFKAVSSLFDTFHCSISLRMCKLQEKCKAGIYFGGIFR